MKTRLELEQDLAKAHAVMKHCLKSEAAPRINAMLDLARSEPGIPILPAEMDRDAWLFNCANGTLELKTGKLREHRREDYITKLCGVEYHPSAKAPLFDQFLRDVFARNTPPATADLIRYLQRLFGYCLTGAVTEHILPIFWGTGANGKSTLVNTILAMMGQDFAIKAMRDLFLARKQDNHPAQLARLFGKRLVVCVETEEGGRLDEVLVKELTGADPITARRMREDPWQFNPTHKAILVTNHKPEIRGTDEGIWRRQRLIPFTVCIPENRQDKDLSAKLLGELPGILAWCVRGCLDWQRSGLQTPREVLAATAQYRKEQDVVGAFIAERCRVYPTARCSAAQLYSAYCQWCRQNGEPEVPQRGFGLALTERGFSRFKKNGVWYRGLTMKKAHGTNGTNGT
jgi:putative DNA primase/helicase